MISGATSGAAGEALASRTGGNAALTNLVAGTAALLAGGDESAVNNAAYLLNLTVIRS